MFKESLSPRAACYHGNNTAVCSHSFIVFHWFRSPGLLLIDPFLEGDGKQANTQTNKTHERLREVNGVQVMCGDVASNNVPLVYFDRNVSKKDLSCSLTKRRRNVNQLIVWIHMKLSRHLLESNFQETSSFLGRRQKGIIANNITPKNVWVSDMTLSLKDSLRLDDSVVPGFSLTALKRKLPQSFTATPPHLTSF